MLPPAAAANYEYSPCKCRTPLRLHPSSMSQSPSGRCLCRLRPCDPKSSGRPCLERSLPHECRCSWECEKRKNESHSVSECETKHTHTTTTTTTHTTYAHTHSHIVIKKGCSPRDRGRHCTTQESNRRKCAECPVLHEVENLVQRRKKSSVKTLTCAAARMWQCAVTVPAWRPRPATAESPWPPANL